VDREAKGEGDTVRSRRPRTFSATGLTSMVEQRLDRALGDLRLDTQDFGCCACTEVSDVDIDAMLKRIGQASGHELFGSEETKPVCHAEDLAEMVVRMIRALAKTITSGTESDREEIAASYVLRYLFDLIHGGADEIYNFAAYIRMWYGIKYQHEVAEAAPDRLAAMVEHLQALCRGIPDTEVMPAAFFPLTILQRDVYFCKSGETAEAPPLTAYEQVDLRSRLIKQFEVRHLMLLTDQLFLDVVAEVRTKTAKRVALAEEAKRLLISFCVTNFGLNPDQPLPATAFGELPDLSGLLDVKIEVGSSDRVENGLLIRIVSAAADEASSRPRLPFGIIEIRR